MMRSQRNLSRNLPRWLHSAILGCLLFSFGALIGSRWPSTAYADVAIAVMGSPKIDGEVDECWLHAPAIRINRPVLDSMQIELADAATASARILWDASKLYVLFEVQDKQLSATAPQSWEQDSVEVFFDELLERGENYDANDSQIRANCEGVVSGDGAFDPERVSVVAKKTETGYRLEMSIVPAALELKIDAKLGFELQLNDDPGLGARRAIMKWHHADNESWRTTSDFGTLALVERWSGNAVSKKVAVADFNVADVNVGEAAEDSESNEKPVPAETALTVEQRVPDWAADAIYYQVFPERFRNGDPSNDPPREALEDPNAVPDNWAVTRWTSSWYSRAAWELKLGEDFYEHGVFNRRYGGDLQGVIDKLDYLQQLGINTIYLNPVFYARSLHKYDGNTYHHVDPYFGPQPAADFELMATETSDPATWKWTAADKLFLELIKQAHEKNIRIVMDGVFNHTGRDFFAFADLREKQEKSDYVDWYVVETFDDPNTPESEFKYQCWWGVDTLPEFANSEGGRDLHAGPKKYIFDATRRWMDPNNDDDPSDGIDGWRLDVANEVPDDFWVDWHQHVHTLNPDVFTVAEIWEDASQYLERCGFSATMNYYGFSFLAKGFLIDGSMSASAFAEALQARSQLHATRVRYALQNLIDSHDTDRLASMIVNSRPNDYRQPDRFDYDVSERASPRNDAGYNVRKPNEEERDVQRLVALFQMCYVGSPMIYYGTEAGMWGGDDPDDRKPMVWDDLIHDDETSDPRDRERGVDKVAFDEALFGYYQSLIQLRNDHPSLRRGEFQVLATNDVQKTMVFKRQFEQDTLLVYLNRSDEPQVVEICSEAHGLPSKWIVALSSKEDGATIEDGKDVQGPAAITVRVGARSGAVIEAIAE